MMLIFVTFEKKRQRCKSGLIHSITFLIFFVVWHWAFFEWKKLSIHSLICLIHSLDCHSHSIQNRQYNFMKNVWKNIFQIKFFFHVNSLDVCQILSWINLKYISEILKHLDHPNDGALDRNQKNLQCSVKQDE